MEIQDILKTIERYNPEHLGILENYVQTQAKKNTYDLEANLAVLKLYQFNPHLLNLDITLTILLKALTNFPHTDFVLCKCLLLPIQMQDDKVREIIYLADILEQCDFGLFWTKVESDSEIFRDITGFYDSIRKFVCHVVSITFQSIEKEYLARLLGNVDDNTLNNWCKKNNWQVQGSAIFVATQDENIKTKNITEELEFNHLVSLSALYSADQ